MLIAMMVLAVCLCLPTAAVNTVHGVSWFGNETVNENYSCNGAFFSEKTIINAEKTINVSISLVFQANATPVINGTVTGGEKTITVGFYGESIKLGHDGLFDVLYDESSEGISELLSVLEKDGAEVTVDGNHIIARGKHDFDDAGKCRVCGKYNCQLGKAEHSFDEATGNCTRCGGSKCTLAGHTWGEDGKCRYCTALVCVEGKQPHRWKTNGKCDVCGKSCENAFHNTPNECPDCHQPVGDLYPFPAGSILSEGSLAIIVGVAAAIVFGLVGFLIGRKKNKTAPAGNAEE